MNADPPRRFYQRAVATPSLGVALDERTLRTPGGVVFTAPTAALAQAVAAEWNAQAERILPATMPITQLAFAVIDWTANSRTQQEAYIAAYLETDLVAHRAESPADLVARQSAAWDPLIAWAGARHGLTISVVTGIVAAPATGTNVAALTAHLAALDGFRLTALAQATGLAGSVVIALALVGGAIDAEAAFQAAALDDLWSLERWGEDEEARAKLDSQRAALDNVARFVATLGDI